VISPVASFKNVVYFSTSVATTSKPFNNKNVRQTTNAVRLFPSMKAWLRAMPNAYDAARRCKIRFRIAVRPEILGAAQRREQEIHVADAIVAAMFGELTTVDGDDDVITYPDGFFHRLFRQFPQHIAIFSHDVLGHFNLFGEFGVVSGKLNPVRSLKNVQQIAAPHPQSLK